MKNLKKFESYTSDQIRREIDDIETRTNVIRNALIDKIKTLPQNDKIDVDDKGYFTINKSDIKDKLSPYYLDFNYQYNEIIKAIDGKSLEQVLNTLEKIVETGKIRKFKNSFADTIYLAPEVIDFIKNLLEL